MTYHSDTLAFKKSELLNILKSIDRNFTLDSKRTIPLQNIETSLTEQSIFSKELDILVRRDFFTIFESACLISLDEPSKLMSDINYDDDWKYGEHKQATQLIEYAIKANKLSIDSDDLISRKSLQFFLFERGYLLQGFNDHLKCTELGKDIDFKAPIIEQLQKENENLKVQVDELNKEIEELKMQKIEIINKENAMIEEKITLQDSDLVFIAVLMKTLQNAISVKANKSQAKILQKIEDDNLNIKGLSKSRTEKVMSKANGIYKLLISNKMK